jgi:AmiR/NasT family two-component response regulator
MWEIIEELIALILGVVIIVFRKPLARTMIKTQLKVARHRYNSPEKLKRVEQIGYPVFEIACFVEKLFDKIR